MNVNRPRVFLQVGAFCFASEPTQIHTLLGSCVSVCLFEPINRFGAMNHILLPGKGDPFANTEGARFGVNAMEMILREFARRGVPNTALVAKIFGGASGTAVNGRSDIYKVAEKNVEFVHEFLRTERIPILVEDTGGTDVRAIRFFSDTFQVFVKKTSLAAKYVERRDAEFTKEFAETAANNYNHYTVF